MKGELTFAKWNQIHSKLVVLFQFVLATEPQASERLNASSNPSLAFFKKMDQVAVAAYRENLKAELALADPSFFTLPLSDESPSLFLKSHRMRKAASLLPFLRYLSVGSDWTFAPTGNCLFAIPGNIRINAINYATVHSITPIGVSFKAEKADGQVFLPMEFAHHDMNHSLLTSGYKTVSEKTKNLLSKIDAVQDPALRKAMHFLFFYDYHEHALVRSSVTGFSMDLCSPATLASALAKSYKSEGFSFSDNHLSIRLSYDFSVFLPKALRMSPEKYGDPNFTYQGAAEAIEQWLQASLEQYCELKEAAGVSLPLPSTPLTQGQTRVAKSISADATCGR